MKILKYLILFFVLFFCFSCDEKPAEKTPETQPKKVSLKPINQLVDFLYPSNGSYIHLGDSLPVRYSVLDNKKIDSIVIQSVQNELIFKKKISGVLFEYKTVGKKKVKIIFFSKGEAQSIERELVVFSDEEPTSLTYSIVEQFNHDQNAYTQGLEFVGQELFESTGQYGQSDVRKVDLTSGNILTKKPISGQFFAEGLTYFKHKFYQLTWQENVCFVYDKQINLLQTRTLPFKAEGWGLTHNDTCLIMSDGSEKIYFLDSETLNPIRTLAVYNHNGPVRAINELELINGDLVANIYQSDEIIVIDLKTGKVKAKLNLKGLLKSEYIIKGHTDVLNGIAYNLLDNKLYVTGKNWPFLYQIDVPFLNK